MPRVVLIGTGTHVGKTFVAEALARSLARRGAPVQAIKPIETGVPDRERVGLPVGSGAPRPGTDAERLEAASFHVKPPRPHPLHVFAPPISPHLAAEQSASTIGIAAIRKWCDAALRDATPQLVQVVETAGGVFSPLSLNEDNFDLAAALEPATWVLVAPDSLGVLHDVRATLLAMRARGRIPDYLVLSAGRPEDASTGTNATELRRLGAAPAPLCVVRRDAPNDIEPLADLLVAKPT